ncbi:MAG: transglutaminase family protein [Candidatus Hadarchaeum sp.]
MEVGRTRRTAAWSLILIVSFAVILVSAVSIQILTRPPLPQPEEKSKVFYYYENTIFRIAEGGGAEAEWNMVMPASEFTDLNVLSFTGGTIGSTLVHGIGIENARQMYIAELKGSYAVFGQEIEVTRCDLVNLGVGNDLRITAEWTVTQLAHWENGLWKITIEPVDAETYARNTLNQIKDLQGNLSLFSNSPSEVCQLNIVSTMTYLLPYGAKIVSPRDATFRYTIDFGGGTKETFIFHITDVEEAQAVVMEDLLTVTSHPLSISAEELLENTRFVSIEYTDVPPPVSFEDIAAGIAAEMKFGRERNSYDVFLDGIELNLSTHQLLYYSALQIIKIYENGTGPLLSGKNPIPVAPPEAEKGDWDAFLKTLTTEDLVALARDVRDRINSTGKSPECIDSPIGSVRPRDALFTFLRAISFHREQGILPGQLKFLPTPTGFLLKDGVEVPAHLVYFTLGEKYVITGTDRVNQIISELRQLGAAEQFAENACGWVYKNISYPYPLVLGWFTSEEVLEMRTGKCLDKANLYLALMRTAGLPARRVTGFLIFDQVEPPFSDIAGLTSEGKYLVGHAWAEVYIFGEGWLFADPTAGYFRRQEYENNIYSRIEETWQEVLAQYETIYGGF